MYVFEQLKYIFCVWFSIFFIFSIIITQSKWTDKSGMVAYTFIANRDRDRQICDCKATRNSWLRHKRIFLHLILGKSFSVLMLMYEIMLAVNLKQNKTKNLGKGIVSWGIAFLRFTCVEFSWLLINVGEPNPLWLLAFLCRWA